MTNYRNVHKRQILLILFIIICNKITAQITLSGNCKDQNGENISFANIYIFSANDTTQAFSSTITDLHGNYSFENLKPGYIKITATAIGYKQNDIRLNLNMQSDSFTVHKDITLNNDNIALSEVKVTASRRTQFIDHANYTFTDEQIKSSRHIADLMKYVGSLTIDPISGKIKKIDGSSVQILLNGINASVTDLKSIAPEKIKKVEYYTIPPARYRTSGTLINVITKSLDTGISIGTEVSHALQTGFCNDNAYMRLVSGFHQVILNYDLYYRNYTDRNTNSIYEYPTIDNLSTTYQMGDAFGYVENDINIKYLYSVPSSLDFQISFSPNYNYIHNRGAMNIYDRRQNQEEIYRNGKQAGKINIFSPDIDIYFLKQWEDKHEFAFDLTGTYLHNKQRKSNEETDASLTQTEFSDNMLQRLNHYSLTGEAYYMRKHGNASFDFGYKCTLSDDRSTVSNQLSEYNLEKYFNHTQSHYAYGEYSGQWKKLSYKTSVGLTYLKNRNNDTKYDKLYFTPQLNLMLTLNDQHSIQYILGGEPKLPTIAQLSKNASYITEHIIKTGSPDLHSGYTIKNELIHQWSYKNLETNVGIKYSRTSSPIFKQYSAGTINGGKCIFSSYKNYKSFSECGAEIMMNLSAFNKHINILLVSDLYKQFINDGANYKYNRWYTPVYYSIEYSNSKWGISYDGGIASTQIQGTYLEKDESCSNLRLYYQLKNIRFTAGCYWFLTKSKYKSETLPSSFLSNRDETHINDNRSMIVIGFSWNFSKGKKHDIDRKLENHDNDNGVF